jgi:hypothetical protein
MQEHQARSQAHLLRHSGIAVVHRFKHNHLQAAVAAAAAAAWHYRITVASKTTL